tara:strand:+ start:549 stop:1679 length:1131 start_codon:yes stop_codon:yes gene_type:complete
LDTVEGTSNQEFLYEVAVSHFEDAVGDAAIAKLHDQDLIEKFIRQVKFYDQQLAIMRRVKEDVRLAEIVFDGDLHRVAAAAFSELIRRAPYEDSSMGTSDPRHRIIMNLASVMKEFVSNFQEGDEASITARDNMEEMVVLATLLARADIREQLGELISIARTGVKTVSGRYERSGSGFAAVSVSTLRISGVAEFSNLPVPVNFYWGGSLPKTLPDYGVTYTSYSSVFSIRKFFDAVYAVMPYERLEKIATFDGMRGSHFAEEQLERQKRAEEEAFRGIGSPMCVYEIWDHRALIAIALSSSNAHFKESAVKQLGRFRSGFVPKGFFADLFDSEKETTVRKACVSYIEDRNKLIAIASGDVDEDIRKAAIKRLKTPN